MRSFDYFATFNESISILQDLCAHSVSVVAEPHLFDEPKAPTFDSVTDDLVQILKGAPVFYLLGPFTVFPLQFTQLKEGAGAGKFMVDELTQGPVMKGLVSRINAVDGTQRLLPGRISYQDAYRNPETGEWEKPSPALKAAHLEATSAIKKRSVRHEYKPGVSIFIGPEALDLVKTGKAQIKDSHIVPSGKA
jgi:hypothetical protein